MARRDFGHAETGLSRVGLNSPSKRIPVFFRLRADETFCSPVVHVTGGAAPSGASRCRQGQAGPPSFIDGEPHMPQIYALTDFLKGRFTWEEIPKRNLQVFTKLGFKLFQFDVWLQDIWPENGKLNIDLITCQVRAFWRRTPKRLCSYALT